LEPGVWRKEKSGKRRDAAREVFSKVEGVFRKFLNVRGCIYKIFKKRRDAELYFSIVRSGFF